MQRCIRTADLQVIHVRRDGGNDLINARVLCPQCYKHTPNYNTKGRIPRAFSQETIMQALLLADNQCECTSNVGCH